MSLLLHMGLVIDDLSILSALQARGQTQQAGTEQSISA